MKNFDLVVIGSGPGGYVSAIRAAQLGKKVAVVEKNKIGGTCLHVGCIPSKTFLEFGSAVEKMKQVQAWGITSSNITLDATKMTQRKNEVVQTLTGGVEGLLQKNKITYFHGEARVNDDLSVVIGKETIQAKDILLATGSTPFVPSIKGLETIDYMTTDTFFDMETLPKRLCIIGGGVISVELATAMAALEVKVTIVEVANDILLTEDEDARHVVKKHLQQQKIDIITKADIKEVQRNKVKLANTDIGFDQLLIATGRKPVTNIAKDLGLKMDDSNTFIKVDKTFETNKHHVYAIGDVIGGYQLAHAASAEGIYVAHKLAGEKTTKVKSTNIPRCVYTFPEIATIGLSEKAAKEAGYNVKVTHSPLSSNGKALATGSVDGFVKIITETKYNEILGAVVVAENATELIGSINGVKFAEGTVTELANAIWAHPTVSEAIGESAEALYNQAIHM